MSDEESFVILGTSPMPSMSMDSRTNNSTPYCSLGSMQRNQLKSAAESLNLMADTLKSCTSNGIINGLNGNSDSSTNGSGNVQPQNDKIQSKENKSPDVSMDEQIKNNAINSNGLPGSTSQDKSLASSFLLGEIPAEVLKSSIYSQFPSLCSMEACAEDVVKLQNFMTEHRELKNVMTKVNSTIKQFYDKTQQWKHDMRDMESNFKKQLQDCQSQIAMLRNENIELKQDIEAKVEQLQSCNSIHQKEQQELVQIISEKTAQINNMLVQIEKLEAQQLNSYEYVSKNPDANIDQSSDYVSRLEHERIIKEHERKLSELLAENLELKDMQKQYKDEITCLGVNLAAAEELINTSRADISLLKAKDMEKSEIFQQHETEREKMKEEVALLREQVNIYSKDFQIEREARQNLAGEKDQLLQDLRLLQRRNQQLLEQLQKDCQNVAKTQTTIQSPASTKEPSVTVATSTEPSTSAEATPDSTYSCPICNKVEKSYRAIEQHVSICLEK